MADTTPHRTTSRAVTRKATSLTSLKANLSRHHNKRHNKRHSYNISIIPLAIHSKPKQPHKAIKWAILLTSNIFNVGVEKNIQLHRAAFSANYFYQSLLFFLLSNVLLSFRSNFVVNGVVFFIAAFLLSAQLLWTVLLENKLSREVLGYSLFISFIIAQAGIAMSFMPIRSSIYSLFMTACYYSLTGLTYHHIDQRLFKKVVQEYLFVLAMVAFLTVLSVAW